MALRGQSEGVAVTRVHHQMLMVGCGGSLFGLPSEMARGILDPPFPKPSGTVHTGGIVYPLIDLEHWFRLTKFPWSSDARLILCGQEQATHVICVDQVLGITEVDQGDMAPLSPHFTDVERDWFSSFFVFDGRLALHINPRWLLNEAGRLGEAGVDIARPRTQAAQPWPSGHPNVPLQDYLQVDLWKFEEASEDENLPWAQI